MIQHHVNYNMCGASVHVAAHDTSVISKQNLLLEFCADPKSRDEMQAYIDFPDKPKSKNQKYTTVHSK